MTNEKQDMIAERVQDQAAWWCMRLAEGDLMPEEQAQLESWLAEAPANRRTLAAAAVIWQGADHVADAPELIAVRADALTSMQADRDEGHRWRWHFADLRAALALAACVTLLLVAGLVLLRDGAQIYETGVGERRIVRLEDGSRLSLDAATRIEVDYGGERRSLRLLAGRAKFDVARDPLRPFSVRVGDRLVIATGTSFSVELVQGQIRVILYEGRVAVMQQARGDEAPRHLSSRTGRGEADAELRPGRELVAALDRPVATVLDTEPARSLSWENGVLSFSDEPLGQALERVNRYSNLKVRASDEATANLLVSGLFNAGDTEGFVDGVTTLFPVRARREGETIVLTSAGGAS